MRTKKTEWTVSCYSVENPNQPPTLISATSYQNAVEIIRSYVEKGKGIQAIGKPTTFVFTTTDGELTYSMSYEIWEKEIVTETRSIEVSYNL
jgi:hypothetical protein